MTIEVVDSDAASERITEACERVGTLVPHLRAVVRAGDAGEVDIDRDARWISCAALVTDAEFAETVVASTGLEIGTEDPVVAASLLVQGIAYMLLAIPIACATTSGVVPSASADATRLAMVRGRPAVLDFARPSGLVFADAGQSVESALASAGVRSAVAEYLVRTAVVEHLAPLIEAVRRRTLVGSRLLWGNVAASAALGFRTMDPVAGEWVRPLAAAFFEHAPAELQGLGSFLSLEHGGRRGWYWERTNCCLGDRLEGGIRCSDCSLTPAAARRRAYLEALSSDGA